MRLSIFFLTILLFHSCSSFNGQPEVDQAKMQALKDSIEAVDRFKRMEDLNKRKDVLVVSMPYERSEDGKLFYTPLIWDYKEHLSKTGLSATVNEDATFNLVSRLRCGSFSPEAGDRLHNRVELVIGDSVFSTGTTGFGSVQSLEGDENMEVTKFHPADGMIIGSAIARHLKDTIEVHTYFNDHVYTVYTLSSDDKRAMYDCVQLSQVLSELNALGY